MEALPNISEYRETGNYIKQKSSTAMHALIVREHVGRVGGQGAPQHTRHFFALVEFEGEEHLVPLPSETILQAVAEGRILKAPPEPESIRLQAGRELHVALGQAGVKNHAKFASDVLGKTVEHFRDLTRFERNIVRRALTNPAASIAA